VRVVVVRTSADEVMMMSREKRSKNSSYQYCIISFFYETMRDIIIGANASSCPSPVSLPLP